MAENKLTVVNAESETIPNRSFDLGDGVQAQGTLVAEAVEEPVSPTGGLIRYQVGAGVAVALDPPTAAYRYARLRVYHTTQSATLRLYYRQDGTAPLADGTNVVGYLLHGEPFLVRLVNAANFRMIGETGMTGQFEVYAEWLRIPPS